MQDRMKGCLSRFIPCSLFFPLRKVLQCHYAQLAPFLLNAKHTPLWCCRRFGLALYTFKKKKIPLSTQSTATQPALWHTPTGICLWRRLFLLSPVFVLSATCLCMLSVVCFAKCAGGLKTGMEWIGSLIMECKLMTGSWTWSTPCGC